MLLNIFIFLIVSFPLVSSKSTRHHPDGWTYDECLPTESSCEFWLTINQRLTMIFRKDLVYAENGKLYLYNEHPSNFTTEVPIEEVITADGVNRMIEAVNDTLPGPPIVIYEGQDIKIHIRNNLLSDSATIHFHGLHMRDTPAFDGMPYISQCPIGAGQTFTHKFKANQKGTYWYHSHIGSQRTNGIFGPFIIKERYPPGVEPPIDMIMTVGDWHHETDDTVYVKMIYGNFIGRDKYETTGTLDGGHFSGVPWVSALINGKGRYRDRHTGKKIMAPLTKFNVEHGKRYRFRVIGVGAIYPFRVSIDDHMLKMIASDGYDFQPYMVESFIINPGERYDFLLEANQPLGNYWIRAVSMESDVTNHVTEAILHYDTSQDVEPITRRMECTEAEPCRVLNCPFNLFPKDLHLECVRISEMKNADFDDPAPEWKADSQEHFLNFAFPGEKVTPGSVNGRKFEYPGVNSLFQSNQLEHIKDFDCANHDCGDDKICYCHYELKVPFNKTIQMIWTNLGQGSGWAHPIHLHGHSFYLLKLEYGGQDNDTAIMNKHTKDIDCGGGLKFCNSAKWKDPSWENGKIPGLNLKDPPRKDTVIIPTGGYAVIRIRSNNPGRWFLHCHIEVHALDGMGMVLNEAPEIPLNRPTGFPVCNHFYDDRSRDVDYIEKQMNKTKQDNLMNHLTDDATPTTPDPSEGTTACPNKDSLLIIVAAILGAIVLIQILIIFTCAMTRRSSNKESS